MGETITKNNSENTENKTTPETTDESKNTENTQKNNENMIPKDRFDEVNQERIELLAAKKTSDDAIAKATKAQLTKDKKFEELSTTLQKENSEKDGLISSLKLDGTKRDLIQDAINNKEINPKLAKMVVGSTEEELKQSLEDAKEYHKEIMSNYEDDRKAEDDSGAGSGKKKIMSTEEYEGLLRSDPKKADEYLRQWTEQQING